MRISDWSSDVCSSDPRQSPGLFCNQQQPIGSAHTTTPEQVNDRQQDNRTHQRHQQAGDTEISPDDIAANTQHTADPAADDKNGRASCRERVCQYMKIWWVARILKKKNKIEHK